MKNVIPGDLCWLCCSLVGITKIPILGSRCLICAFFMASVFLPILQAGGSVLQMFLELSLELKLSNTLLAALRACHWTLGWQTLWIIIFWAMIGISLLPIAPERYFQKIPLTSNSPATQLVHVSELRCWSVFPHFLFPAWFLSAHCHLTPLPSSVHARETVQRQIDVEVGRQIDVQRN